jgi:TPR repeat protein
MSDLVDGNQSRLAVAHRYLAENDRLYRASLVAAPVSLVVGVAAVIAILAWSQPAPLPPPAVPAAPATAQSHGQPGAPAAAPIPQGHAPPAPTQTVDLKALRDRATIDMAALNDLRTRAEAGDRLAQFYVATLYDPKIANINFQKDAAIAVGWYRKSADQGDPIAQYNLANFYQSGEGIGKDDAQAAFWYRKSADQGFAAAQYQLGLAYEAGRGVAKDAAEAARWCWKAADQGDHNAENELGYFYTRGDGVPLDLAQAVALFRRAAQGAQPLALYNLALSYDKGWAMPRNPIAAYIWYGITARWSDADHRAKAAGELDRLAKEIPPVQLYGAQRAAEAWKPGVRGQIGVAISDLTPDEARAIGTSQTKGAVVRRVEDGSPAARVGLQLEDVVTAVDDQPVVDRASLQNLIGGSVPGQTVALLVEKANHRGSLQLLRVEVGAATNSQ